MSSYLSVRKNNEELFSFSRNDDIYQSVNNHLKYGEWEQVTQSTLAMILEDIEEDVHNTKLAIQREEKALPHLKDTEAIYEAVASTQSLEESLKDYERVKWFIRFLSMILEEIQWEHKDANEEPSKLEWRID